MSVGTGIFLAALFLGLVYLYVNTKDNWPWRKIVKRTGLTMLILTVLFGVVIGGVIGYESYQADKNHTDDQKLGLVKSLEGVTIGQKLSDVEFHVGIKRIPERDDEVEIAYSLVGKENVRFFFDKSTNLVTLMDFTCNDDAIQYPALYSLKIHSVTCGDSSEKILSIYPSQLTRVLCLTPDKEDVEKFNNVRAYDVPQYGVRYILKTNKVVGVVITAPDRLEGSWGDHWKYCQ